MNDFFEIVLDKILGKKSSRLKYVNPHSKKDYVILLHGLNRSSFSMAKLANALSDEGYHTINYSYPSRKYNIDKLAFLFLDNIIETHCLDSKKKIHFVTHSLGGIVLRRFIEKKPLLNIGRVVMITPPNHGTKLVDLLNKTFLFRWILGKAGKQLSSKNSSFVNQLPQKSNFDLGIIAATKSNNPLSYWIFKGKNDGTVPINSTKMIGMRDFIEISTSHFFAPRNDEVIKHTVSFINYGYF